MTNKDVTDSVLKFLQDTNRPWSFNDILEKCGKDNGKSTIQKTIDSLISKEKVVEKLFGKQKIFYIKQEEIDNKQNTYEISQLEKQLINLQSDLKNKGEKIQKLESELKKFNKIPSILDLENERKELCIEIEKNTNILNKIRNSQQSEGLKFSSEEIKNIDKCHEKVLTEFRKRKRMCNEMVDSIMEGYPKTKKQLIEEVGIETDENVGFKLEN